MTLNKSGIELIMWGLELDSNWSAYGEPRPFGDTWLQFLCFDNGCGDGPELFWKREDAERQVEYNEAPVKVKITIERA